MAPRKRLGDLLLEHGILNQDQLDYGLRIHKQWGCKLGAALTRSGLITEELLVRFLSMQLEIPAVDLGQVQVSADVLARLPRDVQERHRAIPVALTQQNNKDCLVVAMTDPTDFNAIEEMRFAANCQIQVVLAGDNAVEAFLNPQADKSLDFGVPSEEEGMVIQRGAVEETIDTGTNPGTPIPGSAPAVAPGGQMGNAAVAPLPDAPQQAPPMQQFEPTPQIPANEAATDSFEDPFAGAVAANQAAAAQAAPVTPVQGAPPQDPAVLGTPLPSAPVQSVPVQGAPVQEVSAAAAANPLMGAMEEPVLDLGAAPEAVNAQALAAELLNKDPRILVGALATLLIEKGILTPEDFDRFFGS